MLGVKISVVPMDAEKPTASIVLYNAASSTTARSKGSSRSGFKTASVAK